jgi:hypothetical protein
MKINNILPTLAFNIQNPNSREFFLVDTSKWLHLENNQALYEITMPGGGRPVLEDVKKSSIQVFNSNRLEITDNSIQDLLDGVYKVRMYVPCTDLECERYTIRHNKLDAKINERVCSMNRREIEDNEKNLSNIVAYLRASEAYALEYNVEEAMYMYEKAEFYYSKL